MISSSIRRLLSLNVQRNFQRNLNTTSVKRSGDKAWVYRRGPIPPPVYIVRLAEGMGALMWYWIIYHCITQYDHLIGEVPYPEPEKWTDAELGIPSDE